MSTKAHRVRDSLIADAAEAQRKSGKIPDTRADEAFWVGTLERVEKKQARGKREPKTITREQVLREKTRRDIEKRGGRLMTQEELDRVNARRKAKAARQKAQPLSEKLELFQMARRLRLLSMFPDWRQKVLDAYSAGAQESLGNPHVDPEFIQGVKIIEVLEQSNAIFGDWRALRQRKITVGGPGSLNIKKAPS